MADEFWTPQMVSGLTGFGGVLVGALISWFSLDKRIDADERLAEKKADFDKDLAERRFAFDKELAERKFALENANGDRRRKLELAEEVPSGFYRVKAIVRSIREPMSFSHEAQERPKANQEEGSVARERDAYYPVIARYQARQEEISDLLAKRYRFAASFGRTADEPFLMLHEALNELVASAQLLVAWAGDGTREADPALWKKMKGDIWWGFANPDPIATKIDAAIDRLEEICRPITEGRVT